MGMGCWDWLRREAYGDAVEIGKTNALRESGLRWPVTGGETRLNGDGFASIQPI